MHLARTNFQYQYKLPDVNDRDHNLIVIVILKLKLRRNQNFNIKVDQIKRKMTMTWSNADEQMKITTSVISLLSCIPSFPSNQLVHFLFHKLTYPNSWTQFHFIIIPIHHRPINVNL